MVSLGRYCPQKMVINGSLPIDGGIIGSGNCTHCKSYKSRGSSVAWISTAIGDAGIGGSEECLARGVSMASRSTLRIVADTSTSSPSESSLDSLPI